MQLAHVTADIIILAASLWTSSAANRSPYYYTWFEKQEWDSFREKLPLSKNGKWRMGKTNIKRQKLQDM